MPAHDLPMSPSSTFMTNMSELSPLSSFFAISEPTVVTMAPSSTPFGAEHRLSRSESPSSLPVSPSDILIPRSLYSMLGTLQTSTFIPHVNLRAICIGQGIDIAAIGLSATSIICSIVGVFIWLLFAYLRSKFRHLYAAREWFVSSEFRPKPLGNSFWAFLKPDVPLVPPLPDSDDVVITHIRRKSKRHFLSDEEIWQRTLWRIFITVLLWSIVGLGGALPLYLVNTPCIAESSSTAHFIGKFSVLQDLSVLRLLNLLQPIHIETGSLLMRAVVNGKDVTASTEIRLAILTVLVIVVAAIPGICSLLWEFTKLVNYYRLWDFYLCDGVEMAWLSKRNAPGLQDIGENQLKNFLINIDLSKGFKYSDGPNGVSMNGHSKSHRSKSRVAAGSGDERAALQIDIHGLFTITDTSQLSYLLGERDVILNNLELAEIEYIHSFRLSTPTSSIGDLEISEQIFEPNPTLTSSLKQHISRPKALGHRSQSTRYPQKRHIYGSTTPTSYVAPSSYYKLRDVGRLSRLSSSTTEDSLAQRISQRIIGTRFQEIQRDSVALGRIPLGSHVQLDQYTGHLGPVPLSQGRQEFSGETDRGVLGEGLSTNRSGDTRTPQSVIEDSDNVISPSTSHHHSGAALVRPRRNTSPPSNHRETFAMRSRQTHAESQSDNIPPPHLRLQTQQPFVRPVSGIDHADLGSVYDNIRHWRSRLKAINAEVAEAQQESFNDIAKGKNVKGWLLIGRGLRLMPHLEIIEGRSKEDIRYGELQLEQDGLNQVAFLTIALMMSILIGAILIAVAGLAVSSAPDVAHYLTFLRPLGINNDIGPALAITIAPSLVTIAFISVALYVIHFSAAYHGSISVSKTRLNTSKYTFFFLVVVGCLWPLACGSLIFSSHAFAVGEGQTRSVATGIVYFAFFFVVLVMTIAVIFPAVQLLQPFRLMHQWKNGKGAFTPRQRFRTLYPCVYEPVLVNSGCILATVIAAMFSLVFPIVGPAVCILLFLSLMAHRYLTGYVYVRSFSSQSSGLLQIWLLQRLADMVALQPLVLGLILLSRRLWALGGVLIGSAALLLFAVETYAWYKLRRQDVSPPPSLRESICHFQEALRSSPEKALSQYALNPPEVTTALPRNSLASVLEMLSLTLAVTPPSVKLRGPVPLTTEYLDDLTATEQAVRANPDAPPRLPPLPFMTHSEEMQGILYSPELLAPPPMVWLPNDKAGVAQSEAADLLRFHGLKAILDVSP